MTGTTDRAWEARCLGSCAHFMRGFALLAAPCWRRAPRCRSNCRRGGNVTHGTATIGAPQGSTLNINQTSNRAIINWNSFSVGAGGTVNFNQPRASAATLNRVTGATPSSIAGTINAPGTVLLVNPNGIAIGADRRGQHRLVRSLDPRHQEQRLPRRQLQVHRQRLVGHGHECRPHQRVGRRLCRAARRTRRQRRRHQRAARQGRPRFAAK